MDSFYDREIGVAWGPITKEEMLDDLLLFNNKNIQHRNTLNCNPTFNDDKEQRLLQITTNDVQCLNVNDEAIVLSSEDEIDLKQYQKDTSLNNSMNANNKHYLLDKTNFNHDIEYHLSETVNDSLENVSNNCLLNSSNISGSALRDLGIFNRSPTPANIEDCTYESDLDIKEDKNLSEVFNTINIGDISGAENSDNEDFIDVGENNPVASKEGSVECNVEQLLTKIDIRKNSSYELVESFSSHSYPHVNNLSNDKCDLLEHDNSLQEIEVEDHLYSHNGNKIHEEVGHVAEDNVHDNSLFNDTLAEMERLLNEGLNGSIATENSIAIKMDSLVVTEKVTDRLSKSFEEAPRTPEFNIPTFKIHPSSEIKPTNLKFHRSNYEGDGTKGVIKKPPKTKTTKIPVPPVHNTRTFIKPVLTPTNNKYSGTTSVPTSAKKRFKNIESPISVYIKNSGMAPLYQKITPSKPLASDKTKIIEKTIKVNKENSIIFPEVTYKPARVAIVTKGKDVRLPQKIESLLQQKSNVIKHEGRIGAAKLGKYGVITNKKLSKAELTLDSNASLNTTEDISIRCTKREFIK